MLAFPTAVLTLFAASFSAAPPSAQMQIRDCHVAGEQIRLLLDTARTRQPANSSSAKTDHQRGWLVIIDSTKPADLPAKSRIIGPLWSVDQVQSQISFLDGVRFTAADVAAGKAKPSTGFDDTGNLIRRVAGIEGDKQVLERLDTQSDPPRWIRVADAVSIGTVGKDWVEGVVRSTLGRTLAQEEADGRVRVYDLFTGQPKVDDWLAAAFADYRKRPDMGNARSWLTADLKYLVISPADIWNTGKGPLIEEFALGGKKYSRAEHGLIYTRPDLVPAVFTKPPSQHAIPVAGPPQGAYSIDGDLLLLHVTGDSIRLATPSGTGRKKWSAPQGSQWREGVVPHQQLDRISDRLIIRELRLRSDPMLFEPQFSLFLWDLKSDMARTETYDLSPLFDVENGVYTPKHATAVGE